MTSRVQIRRPGRASIQSFGISYPHAPQLLVYRLGLRDRVFLRTRSINDEGGVLPFFGERHLPAQPHSRFFFGNAVAVHGAPDLLLLGAYSKDDGVEALIAAGLNEDGGLNHGNR